MFVFMRLSGVFLKANFAANPTLSFVKEFFDPVVGLSDDDKPILSRLVSFLVNPFVFVHVIPATSGSPSPSYVHLWDSYSESDIYNY